MSVLAPSDLESRRFGLSIARWEPDDPDAVVDPDDFDIVIVRRPAGWSDTWHRLTAVAGFTAIHADSLIYWEWTVEVDRPPRAPKVDTVVSTDQAGLERRVREVFAGYRNHYASNPLLDRELALEGYVEWAVGTVRRVGGFVDVTAAGVPIGFGIVDWEDQPPDVRLAGVDPAAQGAGNYRHVVSAMMDDARRRGCRRLRISTQVQNIAPQRTWAALGWRPVTAYDTTHLVRTDLLADAMGTA